MRTKTAIILGSLLLASPAIAADYSQESGLASQYDWSGFYAGIQAGGNYNTSVWSSTGNADFNTDGASFLIGAQIGYLHQFDNNWLVGAEAEMSGTFLSGTGQCSTAVGSVCRTRQDWVGSIRARVGHAFDRFQVYGTAGVAFTDYRFDQTTPAVQSWDDGDTRVGWTVGLGAEYAITEKWTAGLEWKHYDFGKERGTGGVGPTVVDFRETSDTISAKLNYRF